MPDSHYLVRIGEIKIFHKTRRTSFVELKIERFWPGEAELNLNAVTLFESAR